jgi:hypothetical protein
LTSAQSLPTARNVEQVPGELDSGAWVVAAEKLPGTAFPPHHTQRSAYRERTSAYSTLDGQENLFQNLKSEFFKLYRQLYRTMASRCGGPGSKARSPADRSLFGACAHGLFLFMRVDVAGVGKPQSGRSVAFRRHVLHAVRITPAVIKIKKRAHSNGIENGFVTPSRLAHPLNVLALQLVGLPIHLFNKAKQNLFRLADGSLINPIQHGMNQIVIFQ